MHTSGLVWAVLAAGAAVSLAVIVRTKWLQSHTLPKCVLLSVVLHAVVAAVCSCLGGLSPASWGRSDSGPMTMVVVAAEDPAEERVLAADGSSVAAEPVANGIDVAGLEAATRSVTAEQPAAAPVDHVPLLEVASEDEAEEEPHPETPEPTELAAVEAASASAEGDHSPALSGAGGAAAPSHVPPIYADRVAGRRSAAAVARGGSVETERAVQAALAWLAAAQSADGRWNAARHGAGVERSVPGHHRHGVGAKSDHGVTGLSLLAFLGAGNTHREGPYSEAVARGIRFLVDRQRADGSLAGDAEFFATLYCHGMAAIALAECCAMTGDATLRQPLEKAVQYTLSMQSPSTGGWRYAAGDKGDTSQLGWQVMLLTSGRQAGLTGMESAEARARTFLQSVSSGRAGGLAAYRPGERPSMAMTAEALACRLFLGMPADHPCVGEAVEVLARSPPETRSPNAYAWYYATLASFHAGGPQWESWNRQLQAALLPLQRRESSGLDGSWDPDPVWGGHGGRVYATAMAAMTLEVYYRHLPMHRQTLPIAGVPSQPPR
jgi:Squalene-hopene cyclase C-terminal domain